MYTTILTRVEDGVGIITLNRPDVLNGLSLVMREELLLALQEMEIDENIKVLLINANGRGFCAGGDIKEQGAGFDAISGRARVRNLHRSLKLMVNMEKPIVVAVNGVAAGAGFSLALAGDFIIAAEEAKFSQVFINIGFVPDYGSAYFLPRMIGVAKAKELIFTGRTIGGQEAYDLGIVAKVVPLAQLDAAAMEIAKTMAQRSAKALAFDKMMLNKSMDTDFDTMLELEAFAQGICFQSDEHKQALKKLLDSKKK